MTVVIDRMRNGNLSNVKSVGDGVLERRVNFGPGYRIYFGRKGDALILLLGGGSKFSQRSDIQNARNLWRWHNSSSRRR